MTCPECGQPLPAPSAVETLALVERVADLEGVIRDAPPERKAELRRELEATREELLRVALVVPLTETQIVALEELELERNQSVVDLDVKLPTLEALSYKGLAIEVVDRGRRRWRLTRAGAARREALHAATEEVTS